MQREEIGLDQLAVGQTATVVHLALEGAERRRLLDLGMITGTKVEALYKSPFGSPVAYLIRGAVIALRQDLTKAVLVQPDGF